MTAPVREGTSLRRSLSVWQAVGLSVALMAPSMAANINPQGTAGLVGRATPLAFFLAASRSAADRLRLRPALPVLWPSFRRACETGIGSLSTVQSLLWLR